MTGSTLVRRRKGCVAVPELALELLEDGSCRKQPKYVRHLTRVAADVLSSASLGRQERLAIAALDLKEVGLLHERLVAEKLSGSSAASRLLLVLAARGDVAAADTLQTLISSGGISGERLLADAAAVNALPIIVPQLADLLPDIPPQRIPFRDRLTVPTGAVAHQDAGTEPPWVHEVLKYLTTPSSNLHNSQFRLAITGGRRGHRLALRGMEDGQPLAGLVTFPYRHTEWAPLVAAGIFARAPSRQTLSLAISEATGGTSARWLAREAPWPLGALAPEARHLSPRETAAKVANGEYGDVDQWIAAEARWRRNGITPEDLQYALELPNGAAFDDKIDRVGFPLGSNVWTPFTALSPSNGPELLNLWLAARPSPTRSDLARLLLRELPLGLDAGAFDGPSFASSYHALLEDVTWSDARTLRLVPLEALNVIRTSLPGPDRARVYDLVGGRITVVRRGVAREDLIALAEDVIASFRAHPAALGHMSVLALLSELVRTRHLFSPLLTLPPVEALDAKMRLERALLALVQSGPMPDVVDELMDQTTSGSRYGLMRCDSLMLAQGDRTEARENVLLRIVANLGEREGRRLWSS